jgi:integrase
MFVALTGVRRGELLGLRWSDLDLVNARATITQTVIPTGGKRWEIKPTTKTDHPHTIALDTHTVAALTEHRERQKFERALWGDAYVDYDLVFCRENGEPLDPSRFSETFAAAVRWAKLPPIRLHDLRHTHATHLLANGESLKVVSERLGHADVKITLQRYSHVIPGLDAEAARKAASYVFGDE